MKIFLTCVPFLFASILLNAQQGPKIKFGSVSADDFKKTVYDLDSNASAVVIADIGSTEFTGNNKGDFSLTFKRFRRAHILNKNGYGAGDVRIQLYTSGDNEEDLENLKAVTYNLVDGKVVQTKLDVKDAVYKDRINKNLVVKKFTFPNLKEGSIIEFEYKLKSDFIAHMQGWEFQGEYPVLWSEYNVANPSFFSYVTLTQGYHPYAVREQTSSQGTYNMADIRGSGASDRASFTSEVVNYRWAMENVPALKEESYTSTIDNHISKIEFQLSSIGYPFTPRQVMSTWQEVAKQLLDDEQFGAQLGKDYSYLNEVMTEAIGNAHSPEEKASNIYAWVRDHFTCTSHGRLYMDNNLRTILKNRTGSEAEINLLLTCMLRKAGFTADPVMLSTRDHGYTHSVYPLMTRFNYVISRLLMGEKAIYLDASYPAMGFGRLNYLLYNGHARVINLNASAIELSSDNLKEESRTSVFFINDEKGNIVGTVNQTPGYMESYRIRKQVGEKGNENYFSDIRKALGSDYSIEKAHIDSVKYLDEPVTIGYDLKFANEKEDIIYFNPMMNAAWKENPFKSAQRSYPVEMPYAIDEIYTLQMEVPEGYVVDELPKQAIVKFNEEEDAIYEYRLTQSGNNISMRSRLIIKKTFFLPEEYEVLRAFFDFIVSKQTEQIVFKKKK